MNNRIACTVIEWQEKGRRCAQAVCRECGHQGPRVNCRTRGEAFRESLSEISSNCTGGNRGRVHYHSVVPAGVTLQVQYLGKWYPVWFEGGSCWWKHGRVASGDETSIWVYMIVNREVDAKHAYRFVRRLARSGYRTVSCKLGSDYSTGRRWSLADERKQQAEDKADREAKRKAAVSSKAAKKGGRRK